MRNYCAWKNKRVCSTINIFSTKYGLREKHSTKLKSQLLLGGLPIGDSMFEKNVVIWEPKRTGQVPDIENKLVTNILVFQKYYSPILFPEVFVFFI